MRKYIVLRIGGGDKRKTENRGKTKEEDKKLGGVEIVFKI
jgi:hypothetical protein